MTRGGWKRRSLIACLVVCATGGALFAACAGDEATDKETSHGATSGAAAGGGGGGDAGRGDWRTGPCGACVLTTCGGPVSACESDAECAAYLSCLYACPLAPSGDADPACEAACPQPTSPASVQALADVTACRSSCPCEQVDAGPECPHPLLCQRCTPDSTNPNKCTACWENACCDSVYACETNVACKIIVNCTGKCPATPAEYLDCEVACGGSSEEGYALFRAVVACIPYHCAAECGGFEAACLECQNEHCAFERTTCWMDPECAKIMACTAHCALNDAACVQACSADHPDAASAYNAMIACTARSCDATCL